MNCSNSGQPLNQCTCGYCNPEKPCPLLNKDQCPIKALCNRIEQMNKENQEALIQMYHITRFSNN